MPLLGFLRRQPPIREVDQFVAFIDEQSAYLIQRYIYDYTHARAGPYSRSLLIQPEFQAAIEQSRWAAYPLGLAMVGEMVQGVLEPHAGGQRHAVLRPLSALIMGIFDSHGVPSALGAEAWAAARQELALKLEQVGLHPPKRVIDIPETYAERYFHLMPFDEKLLTDDVPTTRNYLRLNLTNIRDELVKRMDAADMVRRLRAR